MSYDLLKKDGGIHVLTYLCLFFNEYTACVWRPLTESTDDQRPHRRWEELQTWSLLSVSESLRSHCGCSAGTAAASLTSSFMSCCWSIPMYESAYQNLQVYTSSRLFFSVRWNDDCHILNVNNPPKNLVGSVELEWRLYRKKKEVCLRHTRTHSKVIDLSIHVDTHRIPGWPPWAHLPNRSCL